MVWCPGSSCGLFRQLASLSWMPQLLVYSLLLHGQCDLLRGSCPSFSPLFLRKAQAPSCVQALHKCSLRAPLHTDALSPSLLLTPFPMLWPLHMPLPVLIHWQTQTISLWPSSALPGWASGGLWERERELRQLRHGPLCPLVCNSEPATRDKRSPKLEAAVCSL